LRWVCHGLSSELLGWLAAAVGAVAAADRS
jgi:hypothetical protein